MKVLQIGDESLNKPVEITSSDEFYNHDNLISEMIKVCKAMRGMGLSANQVGHPVRMFIMRDTKTGEYKEYFNPEIISGSGRHRDLEGCLSFREPEVQYYVRRKMSINLTYRDIDNTVNIKTFTDLEARCVQHEIDHLNGITMNVNGKLK